MTGNQSNIGRACRAMLLTAPLLGWGNAEASSLYISEYVEGSASNKALEIFNAGSEVVNLEEHAIRIFANGGEQVSSSISLAGSLDPGQALVIAHYSAELPQPADITGNLNFNGDDAVELYDGANSLDVIGVIGEDPGSAWESGELSTKDMTLIRKAWSALPGWDPAQWTALPKDSFADLGQHSPAALAAVPIPAAVLLLPGALLTLLFPRRGRKWSSAIPA